MPPEQCSEHSNLASKISSIDTKIGFIKEYIEKQDARITKHIEEGEKSGGFRDRLIIVEQNLSALKKAMWIRVIVAGLIGGLIGSGSADALGLFLRWLMKVA